MSLDKDDQLERDGFYDPPSTPEGRYIRLDSARPGDLVRFRHRGEDVLWFKFEHSSSREFAIPGGDVQLSVTREVVSGQVSTWWVTIGGTRDRSVSIAAITAWPAQVNIFT